MPVVLGIREFDALETRLDELKVSHSRSSEQGPALAAGAAVHRLKTVLAAAGHVPQTDVIARLLGEHPDVDAVGARPSFGCAAYGGMKLPGPARGPTGCLCSQRDLIGGQ